ncbi:MAG TPA: Spy/CpxP family protein refolding chaperone [Pyrinomonadaceae bacterium]|jgi:protein CpxP
MRLTGSKKILGGLALAGTLALSGIVGFAQQGTTQGQGGDKARGERGWNRGGEGKGHRGMGGGFLGRFGERLNLTDAQKEQLRQIATRYHESFRAQREQRRGERRGGGFDPLAGGTFDEAAVRAAAQARAAAHVEREVAHARMMYEMYNVLTPEQKAQLAAERQQREQRRQERRRQRQQQQDSNLN